MFFNKKCKIVDNMVKSVDRIPDSYINESGYNDSDAILTEAMHTAYTAVYYGIIDKNNDIITEGFKDWVNKVVDLFKRMLNSFLEFVKKSVGYLQSYLGDFEKFCEKYEKNVTKFKSFSENIFEYTISSAKIDEFGLDRVVDEYNKTLGKVKEMSKGDLQKYIVDASSRENMDKIRGKLCGGSVSVTSDRFKEALEKSFRNGKTSTTLTTIDSNKVSTMITDYKKFKEMVKSVEDEANDIRSMFNDMIGFFKNMPTYTYENSDTKKISAFKLKKNSDNVDNEETHKEEHNDEYYRKLTAFYSFCSKHAKDIQQLYTRAYTTKVDAIKEAMSSHKSVIRKAINPFNVKEGDK